MNLHAELASQFKQRRLRNPRYSLRAFARDLGSDHSTLSQILRQRRPLSSRMATMLGERLGLDRRTVRQVSGQQNAESILRLMRTRAYRPDSRWIAIRTGLSLDAVNAALSRLLREGKMVMHSARQWKLNTDV